MTKPNPTSVFWPRLAAAVFDFLILAIVGYVLSIPFLEEFARIGPRARLVGLAVAWPYFALMNSELFGGQTLGKRLFGVRVVGADGKPVSLGRSAARMAVYLVPMFLNGVLISDDRPSILAWVQAMLVFVVHPIDYYFVLFNQRSRQSLHDLACGTWVVSWAPKPVSRSALKEPWPGHYALAGAMSFAAVVTIAIFFMLGGGETREMSSAYQNLRSMDFVNTATLFKGTVRHRSLGDFDLDSHYVKATLNLKERPYSYESVAAEAAQRILEGYPNAKFQDAISVSVRYGFDIGIASWQWTHDYTLPPTQWDDRMEGGRMPASERHR